MPTSCLFFLCLIFVVHLSESVTQILWCFKQIQRMWCLFILDRWMIRSTVLNCSSLILREGG